MTNPIPDEIMQLAQRLFENLEAVGYIWSEDHEKEDVPRIARALMAERNAALEEAALVAHDFGEHFRARMSGYSDGYADASDAITAAIRDMRLNDE